MAGYISFDTEISEPIRIVLTRGANQSAVVLGCTPEWFRGLSSNARLLVSASVRDRQKLYDFVYRGISLLCVIESDQKDPTCRIFKVISVSRENFNNKMDALHHGICFRFKKGILISYFSSSDGFHFNNGVTIQHYDANQNCNRAIDAVQNHFTETEKIAVSRESYEPTAELVEKLYLASEYSDAAYELERKKSLTTEPLVYTAISGSDYAALANPAYRFRVRSVDSDVYQINAKVELLDRSGEENGKHQATIISIEDEGEEHWVELLFNEQVGIDEFPIPGQITLSFSSVNHDVQAAAVEKIMNGTADAKYMDNILGLSSPTGFDPVDLSELEAAVNKRKYPPNESQMEGIRKGIRTKDVYLVMGPPGTGKTTVILEWIRYFVGVCKYRVLVSSQNNMAVDNVLERIMQEDDIEVLRIGSESKVSHSVLPCVFENKIHDLREKIDGITLGNLSILEERTELWERNAEMLSSMEPDYRNLSKLEESLHYEAAALGERWKKLLGLMSQHRKLGEKITEAAEEVNTLIDTEEAYRNFFLLLRILLAPFAWFRRKKIRDGVAKYDEYREQESKVIASFHSQYAAYALSFDKISEKIFLNRELCREKLGDMLGSLLADLKEEPDPWNIFVFDQCLDCDPYSLVFAEKVMAEIRNSLERGRNLSDSLREWRKDSIGSYNMTLKNIVLESVNLVGATCIGINSQQRFADLDFDVTIIDEAGQIQIHNALVPMSVSNKLIMLGDHKQIPPMADPDLLDILEEHDVSSELVEKSLFEVMYNCLPDSNKSMLDTQFRMPGEIADILSEWFYDGRYKSADFKRGLDSELPALTHKPFLVVDTSDGGTERYETSINRDGQVVHTNPMEARIAADIAAKLYCSGYPMEEVGIITGLAAQVGLIRSEMCRRGIPSDLANRIAATLDSYQGQERQIIIYSFSRSSTKKPDENGVGFLTELRRLNVAMSRCKKMLIMLGDMKFLSERNSVINYRREEITDPEKTERNFGAFIRHILKHIENGSGEKIGSVEFKRRMKVWNSETEGGGESCR